LWARGQLIVPPTGTFATLHGARYIPRHQRLRREGRRDGLASELMGGGALFGSGLGLNRQLANLNEQLQMAEQRESQVDEARRLRHDRHVAGLHRMRGQVEAALGKIEDGTFGHCDGCDRKLDENKLKADRTTSLCDDCKGL
jgi:RNA polymerase-binding transcription factor DksA